MNPFFFKCGLNLTIRYEIISLLKISEIRYEIKLQEENEHIYPTLNTQMINYLKLDWKKKWKYFLKISELF